ncbi:hypothetical protein HHK36_015106 [Tetracentron sinense]|uniref:RING-type E3 ubiquitin transferase n=1 Tax=Tetracentron sinense TaxID=13715 RepID=A0A835DDJ4_TETSI|nr:hypothetical protein HHK36_015106 [Tetracentron sinense]
MAEILDIHRPEEDEEIVEMENIYSFPCSSNDAYRDNNNVYYASGSASLFPQISELNIDERDARIRIGDGDVSDSDSHSVTDLNYFICENQVNLNMDLLEPRVEQSHFIDDGSVQNLFFKTLNDSNFGVLEGDDEIGISNHLELGSGLGLGLGLGLEDENGDFMIAECGAELFECRRASVSESAESSKIHEGEFYEDGLIVIGIGSDSDEEGNEFMGIDLNSSNEDRLDRDVDDLGLPLSWDFLRLEYQSVTNEDFEWEEVDNRDGEGEVLGMIIDAVDEVEAGESREEPMQDLAWEAVLVVTNLERDAELEHDIESLLADPEGYIYTADNLMLFGQFMENESPLRGSLPASKSAVQNLSSVLLTQEDVKNNNTLCAVCKDEISTEEKATQLPCSHHYHGDCILPWLSIRNTCPVCRYELPTDDADYEQRTQRVGRGL